MNKYLKELINNEIRLWRKIDKVQKTCDEAYDYITDVDVDYDRDYITGNLAEVEEIIKLVDEDISTIDLIYENKIKELTLEKEKIYSLIKHLYKRLIGTSKILERSYILLDEYKETKNNDNNIIKSMDIITDAENILSNLDVEIKTVLEEGNE